MTDRGSSEEVVVLLGSGASLPGMLTTSEATKKLIDWSLYRAPVPNIPKTTSDLIYGNKDNRPTFFELVNSIIYHDSANPNVNFEQLIHICEDLGDLLPLPQNPKETVSYLRQIRHFLTLKTEFSAWNISGLRYIAHKARLEVLKWFSEKCDQLEGVAHPQRKFLSELNKKYKLRLFSLNYDDIPVGSGINFYTGFEKNIEGPQQFNPEYPWPHQIDSFCQLHGSVLFGIKDLDICRFSKRTDARKNWPSAASPEQAQDGFHFSTSPMITGLRKADEILLRPYGTYMHVLRDDLLRCSRWIIAGYSFGDPHINETLRQAASNWERSSDSDKLKIVLINHHTFEEYDGFERCAQEETPLWSKLHKLLSTSFESDFRSFLENGGRLADGLAPVSSRLSISLDGLENFVNSNIDNLLNFINK